MQALGNPAGTSFASSERRESTMLRLQRSQRVLLSETVRDVANVAAGAMVFGQFLGSGMFSIWVAVGGTVVWAALVAWAVGLAREVEL
jgi:hypothetical protein